MHPQRLATFLLGCCVSAIAQPTQVPRHPEGVYVDIYADQANQISSLVANPAISGLALKLDWEHLNPNPAASNYLPPPLDCSHLPTYNNTTDPYDWTIPNQAFCAAAAATPSKTIQFLTNAGYVSPRWVLNEINTNTCNGEFVFLPQPYYATAPGSAPTGGINPQPPEPPNPTPACHLAYFTNDEGTATKTVNGVLNDNYSALPMPWDTTYKSAWQTFNQAVAARYGQNPALVSVAVAGPTAASTEILYPRESHEDPWWSTILQNQFPSSYWNSDQAFIEEWENAIDMFGQTYSDITLVVTICCYMNASGMPSFPVSYTAPSGAGVYCGKDLSMGCGAEYAILSYFMQPGVGGLNAKALQNSGQGAYPETTLGTTAIKTATKLTAQTTRMLGGVEFSGPLSFSDLPDEQTLCPDATAVPDTACTAQQAFYNTIADFFDQTTASSLAPRQYGAAAISAFPTLAGGTAAGTTPLNYLQIYINDIADPAAAAQVTTGVGSNPTYTGQQMLNLTSQGLAMIAEQPLAVPASSLSITKTHTGNFLAGQSGATYTVTVSNGGSGVSTAGLVTVTDTIPVGLTLVSMAGTGWSCSSNICTSSEVLKTGSSYPAITVTVNVASTAPSQVINQVTVSGGGSATASATDPTRVGPASGHPPFFTAEDYLGSGVYYLQFPDGNLFGYYNYQDFPILYHYDLGFESFLEANDGKGGAYLYDFASEHWFYASPSLFPYFYDFTLNAWLYYFPANNNPGHYTANPRYFSNLLTGKIFTM